MELITIQVCQSNEPYHTMLARSESNPGQYYQIMVCFPEDERDDWICTCPSWRFRGTCKHLGTVTPCHWREGEDDEIQSEEQRDNHVCPRCFGPSITDMIYE